MLDCTYYLVRFDPVDVSIDFKTMITWLANTKKFILEELENELHVSYADTSHRAVLKIAQSQTSGFTSDTATMVLSCDQTDSISLLWLRRFARELHYRVYSTTHMSFLPEDPQIHTTESYIFNEKTIKVLNALNMSPVFITDHNTLFVKSGTDEAINLVNPALLSYFIDFESPPTRSPELSFAVAPSYRMFVTYYDAGLIPTSFYRQFGKSMKLINESDFPIGTITRKIFIKPFFFAYNDTKQTFEPLGPESASINYADKIRPNETLHEAVRRITRDLGLAEDYDRARVTGKIDFDRDKEGVLTPRLWVCIYLTTVNKTLEVAVQQQRGWVSLDTAAAKQ